MILVVINEPLGKIKEENELIKNKFNLAEPKAIIGHVKDDYFSFPWGIWETKRSKTTYYIRLKMILSFYFPRLCCL